MDPLARLQAAIAQAQPIVSGASPDDYHLPTPCTEWNVRQLINHMISALVMFRDVGLHGSVDPAALEQDLIAGDGAGSFAAMGAAALEAWSSQGRIDGTAALPFGEFPAQFALQLPAMDMVVHGWDLATATRQQVAWDRELVAETLAFSLATFTTPEFRGVDFAPAQEVAQDADDMSRLVAFLGRHPG
jgi:uncharacterized protein (TIGR03086 family)